jgi:catechol 2,3-dioxygenase-like lactoylglutathione lyase family enzyme
MVHTNGEETVSAHPADSMRLKPNGLRAASHVMFVVRDVAASVRFYRDVLGLSLLSQNDGWADFDAGPIKLSLSRASEGEPVGSGGAEIVFGVHDARAMAQDFAARGANLDVEPTPICSKEGKHYLWARVRDPDGNLIGFYSLE